MESAARQGSGKKRTNRGDTRCSRAPYPSPLGVASPRHRGPSKRDTFAPVRLRSGATGGHEDIVHVQLLDLRGSADLVHRRLQCQRRDDQRARRAEHKVPPLSLPVPWAEARPAPRKSSNLAHPPELPGFNGPSSSSFLVLAIGPELKRGPASSPSGALEL